MVEEIKINNTIYLVMFIRQAKWMYYPIGNVRATVTQCVIREKDGLFIGVGEAVKHHSDEDDELIGKRVALKYALTEVDAKPIRKAFWNKLKLGHNETEKGN